MNSSSLKVDYPLFAGEQIGATVVITFKGKPLTLAHDLEEKKRLFDYLDIVADTGNIRVLVINESPLKMACGEYADFYQTLLRSDTNKRSLLLPR
jgi:hypothetical protein